MAEQCGVVPAVIVEVPGLRLVSPGNQREHWRVRARRAADQKIATLEALSGVPRADLERLRAGKRCRVRFTRMGGRKMDSDNLVGSLKHVRDAVAEWIGVDDGSAWWAWEWPAWEPGKPFGVRIELEPMGENS